MSLNFTHLGLHCLPKAFCLRVFSIQRVKMDFHFLESFYHLLSISYEPACKISTRVHTGKFEYNSRTSKDYSTVFKD